MFNITYEIVTEESAEHGEAYEIGFHAESITLREAHDILRWFGGHCEASDSTLGPHTWLSFYCEMDPMTGETTNYGLHFPRNLTGSTRRRIARLFRCYGVK